MAKQPERSSAPIQEDVDITFEPLDADPPDAPTVFVDVELARTPRGETAKAVAAQAKGMEQIEAIKSRRAGPGSVFEINPYDLWLEPGWNVRNFETKERKAAIARLAISIGEYGVKETLLAHIGDGRIIVHSGWNRLLATYHAIEHGGNNGEGVPIHTVPVRFSKASENEADRTLSQLINNGGRSDLTPYELGTAIKRMVNFGWQLPEIAKSIGKSVTNITGLLA